MARVTVDDCLKSTSRYDLVLKAAKRARALMEGSEPMVASKNRPAVTALREIAADALAGDDDQTA